MRRIEDSNYTRKSKHLGWEERIQIETLQREGLSTTLIGKRLQRSARTIRREINRGWVLHRTGKYTVEYRYSADRGQSVYEARMSAKTKEIDTNLIEYLQVHVLKGKESPAVAAFKMKKEALEFAVYTKTIYNLINRGLIDGVSNETLWEKRLRNKKKKKIYRQRKKAIAPEHSIENRPAVINERKEIGHWEIDLIVGGKGKSKAVSSPSRYAIHNTSSFRSIEIPVPLLANTHPNPIWFTTNYRFVFLITRNMKICNLNL